MRVRYDRASPLPVVKRFLMRAVATALIFYATLSPHTVNSHLHRTPWKAHPPARLPRIALWGPAPRFPVPEGRRSQPSLTPAPLSTTGMHGAPARSREVPRAQPRTRSPPVARAPPRWGPRSGSGRAVNVIRPDSVTSGPLRSHSFFGVTPTKRVTGMFAARSWREADRTPSAPGVHGGRPTDPRGVGYSKEKRVF